MKTASYLLITVLLVSPLGCSGKKNLVQWTSLEQTLIAQQDSQKPVLLYFYSNTSLYCRLMEVNTFVDAEVASRMNMISIPVRLNIKDRSAGEIPSASHLADAFHITTVPAMVAVDSNHRMIDIATGFMTVKRTLSFLKKV